MGRHHNRLEAEVICNYRRKNQHLLLIIQESSFPSLVRFVKADSMGIELFRIVVLTCPYLHLFMLRVRRILNDLRVFRVYPLYRLGQLFRQE
jgi:hypothetical protein